MRIAGEAGTAQEALRLVAAAPPDIIFTDICMPLMDGIEFSGLVLQKYPQIKIVIVTGYEEFEYAKRSIKAGVADFILKPINDEEIQKVLCALKEKIAVEKAKQEEHLQLKKQLEESLPYLRERFFNELLSNNLTAEQIKEQFDFYHIEIGAADSGAPGRGQIAVVDLTLADRNLCEEERLILRMRMMNAIKELLAEEAYFPTFFDYSQRIVIFANGHTAAELTKRCQQIGALLRRQFQRPFCIGVGTPHPLERLRFSYREACEALRHQVLLGKNQVIEFAAINPETPARLGFVHEALDMFGFYLKAGLEEQALDSLCAYHRELERQETVNLDLLRVTAVNVISVIQNVLAETGADIAALWQDHPQPYAAVFKMDTYPEIKGYLESLTLQTVRVVHGLRNRKVNKVIQEIENYLINHYPDSKLSLAEVARVHYLNPSYLCRVFKQNTGQSFVEYLTRIRMEKAIKLLRETDLKAYEIADKVGINDPHYFGVCFKKYTGKSLQEFKGASKTGTDF